jgi:hypothetical protein
MADWLEELREEKRRASEQVLNTVQASEKANPVRARLAQLQAQLLELTWQLQIEPLLQEFMQEIIRDHPQYPNSTLTRIVTGRGADSLFEFKEAAPWSAPLEGNYLPAQPQLDNERYIIRIEWQMHLNALTPERQAQPFNIIARVTERGVEVNDRAIEPPTSENFKGAVLDAFQNPSRTSGTQDPVLTFTPLVLITPPLYVRLWQRIAQPENRGRSYIFYALLLIIVAVLIGALVVVILSNVNARPRRRSNDSAQPMDSAQVQRIVLPSVPPFMINPLDKSKQKV